MQNATENVTDTVETVTENSSFLSRLPLKKIAIAAAAVTATVVIVKVVKDKFDVDVEVETTSDDSPQA